MENESPKTEEGAVKEAVIEESVAVTETETVSAQMTLKQQAAAKLATFQAWVSRVDRTTKSFVIVFVVFALLVGIFSMFKGVFVAATVNGETVSRLSVVRELEKQAGKSVLDTMITKRLIEREIKKQKVVVAKEKVDEEIKKVEDQISAQGGTLEMALADQGMTMSDLREQIVINQALEQILADKITVSDEEVDQYLTTSGLPTQGVSSEEERSAVREQLKSQKFSKEASLWVSDLRAKAAIEYHVEY